MSGATHATLRLFPSRAYLCPRVMCAGKENSGGKEWMFATPQGRPDTLTRFIRSSSNHIRVFGRSSNHIRVLARRERH